MNGTYQPGLTSEDKKKIYLNNFNADTFSARILILTQSTVSFLDSQTHESQVIIDGDRNCFNLTFILYL